MGLPDEKRTRRAAGRAGEVFIYSYGGRGADLWWEQTRGKLERTSNVTVINLPFSATQALAKLAQRTMQLQCTIQEGQIWIADADRRVEVDPQILKMPY